MSRVHYPALLAIVCAAYFFSVSVAAAQPRFQLKRTKQEGIPVNIQLLAGYNGVSNPADKIQDLFEGTYATTWGGVMVGLQATAGFDTLILPYWLGIEVYYNRMARRGLDQRFDVYYPDEPETRIDKDESLYSAGFQLVLAVDVSRRLKIEGGVGTYYLFSKVEQPERIVGLFPTRWVPTVMLSADYQLLKYAHGSIDVNLRGMQGLGDYGSFHFQSLLGFTFAF